MFFAAYQKNFEFVAESDPIEILNLPDLENFVRCLDGGNLNEADWKSLIFQNLVLPLWKSSDRVSSAELLSNQSNENLRVRIQGTFTS